MKDERYCYECDNNSNFYRILKEQTINVLGTMPVTFVAPISMCGVCHQEIFDMEIDSLYQERAYQLCGLVEDKVHQFCYKSFDD